jgi:L-alanine-DL-glutamate epimerase-like enolase superfamily enzyme
MKITDVRIFPFGSPTTSHRFSPILFVRVDTDSGISGWGEGSTWAGGSTFIAGYGSEIDESYVEVNHQEAPA